MAPVMSWVLLLVPQALANPVAKRQLQAAPLKHAGQSCYWACWKTAGYCDYCGVGNACCTKGKGAFEPDECGGDLNFKAPLTPNGIGQFPECVVARFLPGATVDDTPLPDNHKTHMREAQCIGYMAQQGCGWTSEFSCPGQTVGRRGVAQVDVSRAYKCCCTNEMWKEDAKNQRNAVVSDRNRVPTQEQCRPFMNTTGCGWTVENNCPGQPAGSNGEAENDDSEGYKCCCRAELWRVDARVVAAESAYRSAQGLPPPPALRAAPGLAAAPGSGYAPVPGSGYAPVTTTPQLNRHDGANVHVATVSQVTPDFVPTKHHGPINNQFSLNDPGAKSERCEFGICADLNGNDPDGTPATDHGVPVKDEANPNTLPSYKITVDKKDGDRVPKVALVPITGAVVTENVGAPGVPAPATAAATPPPVIVKTAPATAAATPPPVMMKNAATTVAPAVTSAAAAAAPAPAPAPPVVAPTSTTTTAAAQAVTTVKPPVTTNLTVNISAGTKELPVVGNGGFYVGDVVVIGTERRTIVGFGSIILDRPLENSYPAGTAITKEEAPNGSSGASSNSTVSGVSGAVIWGVVTVCLLCLVLAVGAGLMQGRKKTKRGARGGPSDREAYIKNDFIERQPINNYNDAPTKEETEPMMSAAAQEPVEPAPPPTYTAPPAPAAPSAAMQPTDSFPVQVELPPLTSIGGVPPLVPMVSASPSLVSFPGMPTLGGAAPSLGGPGSFVPASMSYQVAAPQASSMNVGLPYGNYANTSTFVSAPPMTQLGQTSSLSTLPQYATPSASMYLPTVLETVPVTTQYR